MGLVKGSHSSPIVSINSVLLHLQVIANIRRILSVAHLTGCLHICTQRRVVLGRLALLVPSKRIPSQIRKGGVEAPSCLGLFVSGCLLSRISFLDPLSTHVRLTVSNPQTKSRGRPYLKTVSTNTLNTITWTHACTASLHPVLPSLSVSPHNFLSSAVTLSTSFASASFPPSRYLKSLGTHFFSLHLCTNSDPCFLNVVTA